MPCVQTWTDQSASHPGSSSGSIRCAYGNDLFIMGGGTPAVLHTSLNGINWTARTIGMNDYCHGIVWDQNNSLWIISGWSTGSAPKIETSPDGITWTNRTFTVGTKTFLAKAATGNGTTFVCPYNTQVGLYSTNGTTWNETGSISGINIDIVSACWAGGTTWYCVRTTGTVYKSTDGCATWSATGGTAFTGNADIIWDGSQLIACGTDRIQTSPDGITWTERYNDPSNYNIHRLLYTGSCYMASGDSGLMLESVDAITWNTISLGSTSYQGLAASKSKAVVTSGTEVWNGSIPGMAKRGTMRGVNYGIMRGI